MLSKADLENAERAMHYYLARLSVNDIPSLEPLEDEVGLSFWGRDNYRRFLEDFPEYFGCKAMAQTGTGPASLAGFVFARSVSENLEILKLGVLPVCQRRGIGTQLMENAYAEGIRRGCSRCFLEVRKSNLKAIQFYYRQDFRVAGTRLNYYTDPVEDAWIMERRL
jgi:ribosomal-protein-alanine N-acetyltransferase